MNWVNIYCFFFSMVINPHFITKSSLARNSSGHAMKTGEETAVLHRRINNKIDGIATIELLKIVVNGHLSSLAMMFGELMPGFTLRSTNAFDHTRR